MAVNTRVIMAIITIFLLLSIGTVYLHETEDWTYTDSFYYSTMLLTTIGDNSFELTHDYSKLFISFYALFGIGIMLYVLSSVVGSFIFNHEKDFAAWFKRFRKPQVVPIKDVKSEVKKEIKKELKKKK